MNRIYDSRAHRQCELVCFFKCVFYLSLPRQRFNSYIKIISYTYKLLCASKGFASFMIFYTLLMGNRSIGTDIVVRYVKITHTTHSFDQFQY